MTGETGLRRWWGPLGGAVAGAGLGIVIGGGLAPRIYDWTTEWNVDAPLADVYAIMSRSDSDFWPSMEVARVLPDARAADGKVT